MVGAQVEVTVNNTNEIEVYFGNKIAPGFFSWLVPTSQNKALIGVLTHRNPGSYLRRLISSLHAAGKVVLPDELNINYGGVPLTALPRTYKDRVLVVGDTAGQVKPITAGGIYYGLLCADIAAENLDRALITNDLSAKNLVGYQRQWRKKLGQEIKISYLAHKFYERLNDREIDKVFDIIYSHGITDNVFADEGLSFDWHGKFVFRILKHPAMFTIMMKFLYYSLQLYLRNRF
jgi:flavin-dependent dehydrogenase